MIPKRPPALPSPRDQLLHRHLAAHPRPGGEKAKRPRPEQTLEVEGQESDPLRSGALAREDVNVKPGPPARPSPVEDETEALVVGVQPSREVAPLARGDQKHLLGLLARGLALLVREREN